MFDIFSLVYLEDVWKAARLNSLIKESTLSTF